MWNTWSARRKWKKTTCVDGRQNVQHGKYWSAIVKMQLDSIPNKKRKRERERALLAFESRKAASSFSAAGQYTERSISSPTFDNPKAVTRTTTTKSTKSLLPGHLNVFIEAADGRSLTTNARTILADKWPSSRSPNHYISETKISPFVPLSISPFLSLLHTPLAHTTSLTYLNTIVIREDKT